MSLDFLNQLPGWAQALIATLISVIGVLWREVVKANREKTALMLKLVGMIGSTREGDRKHSNQGSDEP